MWTVIDQEWDEVDNIEIFVSKIGFGDPAAESVWLSGDLSAFYPGAVQTASSPV